MRLHIRTFRIFLLALFAIVALISCKQEEEKFKSYSIGFTTQGQEVSVDAAHIDNLWAVPGGVSIAGVWGEEAGGASVFDKPMPHKIRVNWLEKATNRRYEATVKLVDDLAKRAKGLPPIRLNVAQSIIKEIYIIIGMSTDGKVIVWLTNAPYASGITGRVIEVIGKAQGTPTKEVRPYYPSQKTKR